MKLFEITNDVQMISFDDDSNGIEGYIVSTTAEQIPNWLTRNGYPKEYSKMIMENYKIISFLNNIYVDEDSRGGGIGSSLLEQFINESADSGAEAIFLSADSSESQQGDFDLIKWYESWGFEKLTNDSNPLMKLDI